MTPSQKLTPPARRMRRLFLILAAGGGCAPAAGLPATTQESMWRHFGEVAELQYAMVRGDLPRAREAARSLEEIHQTPGIPQGWAAEVETLRRHAAEIRTAGTFRSAASAAANLAAACGACHTAHDAGPIFTTVQAPPEVGEVDHMVAHIWAADRLWEGLVIPSDERWMAGARVLADHLVPMSVLARGTSGLGVELKSLGLDAMHDATPPARADRYARILETCAACHRRAGAPGPGAPLP